MVRRRHRGSLARRQHRAIGVTVSVFVLLVVLTGLALNHSASLRLDQRKLTHPGLLDWYGLEAPETIASFEVHPQWLSHAGSRWYLDGTPVAGGASAIGAVAAGEWLMAAGEDGVLIITRGGEVVERLGWDVDALGPIGAVGKSAGGLVVLRAGDSLWQADSQWLGWTPSDLPAQDIRWSRTSTAPAAVASKIAAAHRGDAMTVERVLLDLHSGRFFGDWGVIVYDLLALGLASLAISGLLLWFRGRTGHRLGPGRRADRYRPGKTRR